MLVVLVLAVAVFVVVSATKPASAVAQQSSSRCSTETQPGVNSSATPYRPPKNAQPATLTPAAGSQAFSFPLWRDLEPKTTQITLTADKQMPISANDLEVAFRGDMRRVDGNEIFPLNEGVQQARIVPSIRADGRLVTISVCIDPGQR